MYIFESYFVILKLICWTEPGAWQVQTLPGDHLLSNINIFVKRLVICNRRQHCSFHTRCLPELNLESSRSFWKMFSGTFLSYLLPQLTVGDGEGPVHVLRCHFILVIESDPMVAAAWMWSFITSRLWLFDWTETREKDDENLKFSITTENIWRNCFHEA